MAVDLEFERFAREITERIERHGMQAILDHDFERSPFRLHRAQRENLKGGTWYTARGAAITFDSDDTGETLRGWDMAAEGDAMIVEPVETREFDGAHAQALAEIVNGGSAGTGKRAGMIAANPHLAPEYVRALEQLSARSAVDMVRDRVFEQLAACEVCEQLRETQGVVGGQMLRVPVGTISQIDGRSFVQAPTSWLVSFDNLTFWEVETRPKMSNADQFRAEVRRRASSGDFLPVLHDHINADLIETVIAG